MNIPNLIHEYGYLAVAIGAFLQGTSILIVAGAAAHGGYLTLPAVIVVGAIASFFGNQLYFYIGRRFGPGLHHQFPSLQSRAARVNALLKRHYVPLILSIRFLFGLRIAGPVAIGMSEVSGFQFLILNFIGAALWAALIAGGSYGFGHGLTYLIEEADRDEAWLLAMLLLSGVIWWLAARRSRSTRPRK